MKTLRLFLLSLLVIATFTHCKKCKNEQPRARISNNGSQKASVQIKTSGGNTVNLNNVQPGTTSDYASYAEGNVEFTISIGNKSNVISVVPMQTCYEYDIAIDDNGQVTSTPHDRND